MVLAESLAMGLVGCVYGAFFGYVMSRVFLAASSAMTGYDLQYTFALRPFVLAILIAVGVSQLAAFIPARRAARINLIEALKHE
jgi:putative ABC transport system permease protein